MKHAKLTLFIHSKIATDQINQRSDFDCGSKGYEATTWMEFHTVTKSRGATRMISNDLADERNGAP